jgi:TonB family protein
MLLPKFASFVIIVAVTAVWPQQAPAPTADQPSAAPIVRDPHSTNADLTVPLCAAKYDDSLATDGVIGRGTEAVGVTRPKPVHMADAPLTDEAEREIRQNHHAPEFESVVGLVVGVDGKAKDICLARSAGYGLDLNAAAAIQNYRFAPAIKDGKQVAVRVTIQIDFSLSPLRIR